jgi:SAM-dependent MidA family methyltransferase
LRILEVGAGFGAACEGVLLFLRNYNPKLFSEVEYNLVELSSAACEGASKRLEAQFPNHVKKYKLRIYNDDFLKLNIQNSKDEIWFILFLEVFDNLPHDKVIN